MKNLNFDFSAFFGSNSNDGFGSFNLKDYASIKNGSYMKLAKSYYSEKKESSSDKKTTDKVKDKTKKETLADTTGLSKMKKEIFYRRQNIIFKMV